MTTKYTYDGWGRIVAETVGRLQADKETVLGATTDIDYSVGLLDGNNVLVKTITYADGREEISYSNALGWLLKSKVLSLNGKYVCKSYEYDAIGRKVGESEPYFENDEQQWNTFNYDDIGIEFIQNLFTGKVIITKQEGLKTIVEETSEKETKTTETTRDAVGNIVAMKDLGGTISYDYYANGVMKNANYGTHIVSTEIDGWGRKKKLSDPSAGDYTYTYNIFGDILTQTTPKGITSYKYDDNGKIERKNINGDSTDLFLEYKYYDGSGESQLLESIIGTDNTTGEVYIYQYEYDVDNYNRLTSIKENTSTANFEKEFTYDTLNRVLTETYKTTQKNSGVTSTQTIKNVYNTVGILSEIKDADTGASLRKVTEVNARGQVKNSTFGNGFTNTNKYDAYGFLAEISEVNGEVHALHMDYSFNKLSGNLKSRTNHNFANWTESFDYDSQNRLTTISGATPHSQEYDKQGRIETNSKVGEYNYNYDSKIYQLSEIDLNNQGAIYYQNHAPQEIIYNAFKKPVSINEASKGRVDFDYGPFQNRTHAYYGGSEIDKHQRQFHKQYSSIIPVEVVEDQEEGSVKIITYIAGDAYTAPIAHIKQTGGNVIDEYYYLHRDYLGSILAITDSAGAIKEQRQFGVWGEVDRFVDSSGNTIFNHSSLIGRGYTGHEHFFEVSLIHMNGRMYDANLGRFLAPDNFIQEPFNTQSFNRYGYVWNNPLTHVDPSGEFIEWLILGAFIYAKGAHDNKDENGKWNWNLTKWETFPDISAGTTANFNQNGSINGNTQFLITPTGTSTQLPLGPELYWNYNYSNSDGGNYNNFEGVDPPGEKGAGGNTGAVLTVGGGLFGAAENTVVNGDNWLGKNGKYYSTNRANGATGSRSGAFKAANQYKIAGIALTVATVALGVYQTYDGYQRDGGQFGYNAQRAAAGAAGGLAGGLAGAKAGAAIGAGIGAFFGGVGAIPGSVIGGFIGGVGGSFAGGYIGESSVNYYHKP